jgi:hypothetical protein
MAQKVWDGGTGDVLVGRDGGHPAEWWVGMHKTMSSSVGAR